MKPTHICPCVLRSNQTRLRLRKEMENHNQPIQIRSLFTILSKGSIQGSKPNQHRRKHQSPILQFHNNPRFKNLQQFQLRQTHLLQKSNRLQQTQQTAPLPQTEPPKEATLVLSPCPPCNDIPHHPTQRHQCTHQVTGSPEQSTELDHRPGTNKCRTPSLTRQHSPSQRRFPQTSIQNMVHPAPISPLPVSIPLLPHPPTGQTPGHPLQKL